MRRFAPLVLVVVAWLIFVAASRSEAQSTSSKVQGLTPNGTASADSAGNPFQVAGKSPTGTVKTIAVDSSGDVLTAGAATEDSAFTGGVMVVAGKDNGGTARVPNVTPMGAAVSATSRVLMVGGRSGAGLASIGAIETTTNAWHSTQGINSVLDTLTPSYRIVSNGVNVATVFTGVASKRWILAKFAAKNVGAVTHTVNFFDQTGSMWSVTLAAGQEYVDDTHGWIVIGGGASFGFAIDASGVATDVECYAFGVNK